MNIVKLNAGQVTIMDTMLQNGGEMTVAQVAEANPTVFTKGRVSAQPHFTSPWGLKALGLIENGEPLTATTSIVNAKGETKETVKVTATWKLTQLGLNTNFELKD